LALFSQTFVCASMARRLVGQADTAMKDMNKKAMKKKAMKKKAAKKKAMKKGSKRQVFKGSRAMTQGGLTKASLIKNKRGKVVSKALRAVGKKNYKNISAWTKALLEARTALVILEPTLIPCGGQTDEGKRLMVYTRFIYELRDETTLQL
jgi:hypothetical protein